MCIIVMQCLTSRDRDIGLFVTLVFVCPGEVFLYIIALQYLSPKRISKRIKRESWKRNENQDKQLELSCIPRFYMRLFFSRSLLYTITPCEAAMVTFLRGCLSANVCLYVYNI